MSLSFSEIRLDHKTDQRAPTDAEVAAMLEERRIYKYLK